MGQYDDELVDSMRTGQWGFSYQTFTQASTPSSTSTGLVPDLLSFSVPAYLTRHWTVTLCAFRYSGNGPLGGLTVFGNAQPADNQTNTLPDVKAYLQWGSFGATERAIIDYPARGCTFQVQASNLRLGLQWSGFFSASAAPPLLAGFVSPFSRSSLPNVNPAFTAPGLPQVAGPGVRNYAVPDRACGYRFMPALQPVAGSLASSQIDGAGNLIMIDGTTNLTIDPLSGMHDGFIPLHPRTQLVQVTNTSAGPLTVYLQFLLDLG